jgi:maltooligosyltrehalose trehalohydrolase
MLIRPEDRGGYGLDALWNDDFHHSAVVALTGRKQAYFSDHCGTPQEFVSALKWGFLYQGQWYSWQKKYRGSPALDLEPYQFINFLDNHDQIANSGPGERIHERTSPARYRALAALLLLGPNTPMLFQGQEFCASAPFVFFADHNPDLANLVRQGRGEFLKQFPNLAQPEVQKDLPDPASRATFQRCKIDHNERVTHQKAFDLHRDLLRLRREDPVISRQIKGSYDGAVLGAEAFVLRFFGADGDERLLIVNLGHDLNLTPSPEPLLAPPMGQQWHLMWSSEDPRYGGYGTLQMESDDHTWRIPGEAALLLKSEELKAEPWHEEPAQA